MKKLIKVEDKLPYTNKNINMPADVFHINTKKKHKIKVFGKVLSAIETHLWVLVYN